LLADVGATNALDSLSMDIEDKILQVDSLSDTLDLLRLDATNPEEFPKLLHLLPFAAGNGLAALCRKQHASCGVLAQVQEQVGISGRQIRRT